MIFKPAMNPEPGKFPGIRKNRTGKAGKIGKNPVTGYRIFLFFTNNSWYPVDNNSVKKLNFFSIYLKHFYLTR